MYQYRIEGLMNAPVTPREDWLYELAKEMRSQTFLIIRPNAANVPEELLGEVVKVKDMFFPCGEKEPLFEISGYDDVVPMSALQCA